MLAITGATGQLGRLVIQSLKDKGLAGGTVALVRDPAKATNLGVATRQADYNKPETLAPALEGVDKLLLISSSEIGQRVAQHEAVIAAARAAGVRQIIYTSVLHADTTPLPLAIEHRPTEEAIRASGIGYVILRNGWYTENYTGTLGIALAHGALTGAAGDGRISLASRADYAEAAALVLAGEGHDGKIYELAGDEPVTLAGIAAEVSRQTGRTLPYNNISPAEYAAMLAGFGVPEEAAKLLAASEETIMHGALLDESRTLSALIGRPTTSLSKAVADALATLA